MSALRYLSGNTLFGLLAIAILIAGIAAFFWLWRLSGSFDSDPQSNDLTAQLMERKTDAATAIRDAIVEEDFGQVEQQAAELRQISEASKWFLTDDQYANLSDDFRLALRRLEVAASDRQTKPLRNAFAELMRSCLECHQHATQTQIDLIPLELDTPPAERP